MQSFVRVFVFAALSAFLATASFAAPATGDLAKPDIESGPTHVSTLPLPPSRHLTNAERMARGLPPNPPHRRSGMFTYHPETASSHFFSGSLQAASSHAFPLRLLVLTAPLPRSKRPGRVPALSALVLLRSPLLTAPSLATLPMLPLVSANMASRPTKTMRLKFWRTVTATALT